MTPTLAVTLQVNGHPHTLHLDPRTTLLDALREHLGLTGAKPGCAQGACGACTVLLDGRAVNACLLLAVQAADCAITTIEGLADGERLHPLQQAFISHDAFQCGYCTPGQIMAALALLQDDSADFDAELAERMSGNLCRCGAYTNILAAIRAVHEARP